MIDINELTRAYYVLHNADPALVETECGDFENYVFGELAREVARQLNTYGPPDCRATFISHLLYALGAEHPLQVEQAAKLAATLTDPDYFGQRADEIVAASA
ncbi:hypothetical protein [Pimelobacter simplex]|uniref:hypothetical protein n=1 Tax=Nocardioides simplex TaxID=2045 RepID=UPI003AB02EE8